MIPMHDLVAGGLIEPVEPDRTIADQWLGVAEGHLDAAGMIAEVDPTGTLVLAYDAARKSLAAALLMSGHRVRTRLDSHRVLAELAGDLALRMNEPEMNRFDDLRRLRNRSDFRPIGEDQEQLDGESWTSAEDARMAISIALSISAACERLVESCP